MLSSLLICKLESFLKAKHNSKHKCESVGRYYPHPERDRQTKKISISNPSKASTMNKISNIEWDICC